jgi:hypothetical protein
MTGYAWFHGIAYLSMIIVVLEIGALLTLPLLGFGLGGLWGRRWVRRRLAEPEGPLARVQPVPRLLFTLVDRACNAAAWPVIQATSLWRGLKAALGSLRRQASSR